MWTPCLPSTHYLPFLLYFSADSNLRAGMLSRFSCVWLFASPWTAGVQPQWIQGIRGGDGVGEDQETTA